MVKEARFYIRVIIIVIILLFPFIIMLSISLKATSETIGYPPTIIPHEWTLEHFVDILFQRVQLHKLQYITNS